VSSSRAVFLDRDGVINKMHVKMGKLRAPYTREEFELIEGVPEAISMLKEDGFKLIIVTNQPDVARGWVDHSAVDLVNGLIQAELQVDEILCCFHVEKDQCLCRKPKPGMLLEGANNHHIDLQRSFMIGDRYSDIAAGVAAGCQTLLVGVGDEQGQFPAPDKQVSSLLEGAKWIRAQHS
jgi:D-glycero-D-manno-heptose 1,7-bisphosphate phosphatase